MLLTGWNDSEICKVVAGLAVGLVIGAAVGLYLADLWPWFGYQRSALVVGGLIVTFGVGHVVAGCAVGAIRRGRGQTKAGKKRAACVGHVERFFFLIATAIAPPVALGGVVGWAALKLGANWGSRQVRSRWEDRLIRIGRMSAIAGSVASLTFAVLGGLLVRCGLPL